MHIISVVGARPQFVKVAPVARAFASLGVDHRIVHTGQHYDALMSDVFFSELGIPEPSVHLGIGSAAHGEQTGRMLAGLETVFVEQPPAVVVVYGDTNSTLAAALAAVKLHIPVAHVEAGLRSFNRRMPEEHNRVLTDHAADLLLAPTDVAMGHLAAEGLGARAVRVGDVMVDVLLAVRNAVEERDVTPSFVTGADEYLLATVHRAENTDDPLRLRAVVEALQALPVQVVLAAHPRLVARSAEAGVKLEGGALRVVEPLAYEAMVAAAVRSAGVVTDSGGLQKEAFVLGVPCSTLRDETEWVETLDDGWNVLVTDLSELASTVTRPRPSGPRGTPYGDGHAGREVAEAILRFSAQVGN